MNIERGIPYPRDPRVHVGVRRTLAQLESAGFKYPFRDMIVGDCFVVDTNQDRQRSLVRADRFTCTSLGAGKRFASFKMPAGYGHDQRIGIWRVA